MTQPTGNLSANLPSEAELKKMSFVELSELREKFKGKPEFDMLAPYEHEQYARGVTAENPLAALGLSVATPLYAVTKLADRIMEIDPKGIETLGKGMPFLKMFQMFARDTTNLGEASPPSVAQVAAGYKGAAKGLGDAAAAAIEPWKRNWSSPATTPPVEEKTAVKPWEKTYKGFSRPEPTKLNYANVDKAEKTPKQKKELAALMNMGNYTKEDNKKFQKENEALIREQLARSDLPESTRRQYQEALGK